MAQSSTLPSTGDVNPLQRQPTTFDFAQTNQFKVYLPIFPTMEWFVVRANIPGVTLGQGPVTSQIPYSGWQLGGLAAVPSMMGGTPEEKAGLGLLGLLPMIP